MHDCNIYWLNSFSHRGHVNENDKFSSAQLHRVVEAQRFALSSTDIRMEVQLNQDFSLLAAIEIREDLS